MRLIVGFGIVIGFMVLCLIAWFTGGSPVAFFAGILLLALIVVGVAQRANIINVPAPAQTAWSLATMICVVVILWAGGSNWWKTRSSQKALEFQQQEQLRATRSAPVVERTVVRNNGGMTKRSFRFNTRTGCVGVSIHGSFEHYLFGGDTLTIGRPHPSGKVDTVPPGADWRPRGNQPAGEYTFCVFDPTPSDSIVVWAENWRN